jgi:hypothetical protein
MELPVSVNCYHELLTVNDLSSIQIHTNPEMCVYITSKTPGYHVSRKT